jgi:hypothetical protein
MMELIQVSVLWPINPLKFDNEPSVLTINNSRNRIHDASPKRQLLVSLERRMLPKSLLVEDTAVYG